MIKWITINQLKVKKMIKPTIGRIVLYRPLEEERSEVRHAAIVTMVHSDKLVNLAVFDSVGTTYHRQSVTLVQDKDEFPSAGQCQWMPYQHGQQAKTEAVTLEAATVLDGFMEQVTEQIAALNARMHEVEVAHPVSMGGADITGQDDATSEFSSTEFGPEYQEDDKKTAG